MNRIIILLFIGLFIFIGCNSKIEIEKAADGYYTCPMHPQIVRDEPGECPICGMDLVWQNTSSEKNAVSTPTENSLMIDPVVIQNMGVRVAHVESGDIIRSLRSIGKFQLADDKQYTVNLKFSGWVEEIFAANIGAAVKVGDPLFRIYSPELIAVQKEYLEAIRSFGEDSRITSSVRRKLELWGISQNHLNQVISTENHLLNPIILSPYKGYILHKTIQAGSNVSAGKDLYHLGDLEKIWIIGDVYEIDTAFLKAGSPVEFELTNLPGRKWQSKIDYIYPNFDEKTRTQKFRIIVDNQDHSLQPGMLASLHINAEILPSVLTVPFNAVINSGNRKYVFLSLGEGRFAAREVETGVYDDVHNRVQILSGLEEGDLVVVSGQFLLDSESQLREAVQKHLHENLLNKSESHEHDHSQDALEYYSCPMHPTIVQDKPGDCPICGMDLVKKK